MPLSLPLSLANRLLQSDYIPDKITWGEEPEVVLDPEQKFMIEMQKIRNENVNSLGEGDTDGVFDT